MENYTAEEGERMHQLWSEIFDQYEKMRIYKDHTVEDDVRHNSNYELANAAMLIMNPKPDQIELDDFREVIRLYLPDWNAEWLERTYHKTYKDRLKVGISLLIAELERVMYLENQRIENNDSSTASNSTDPESNW